MRFFVPFLWLFPVFLMLSCEKDVPILSSTIVGKHVDTSGPLASVIVNFRATVNQFSLQPEFKYYKNSSNEEFTVTKFNYYVSNVKLVKEDGSMFSEKESYHLIKHVEGKTSFTMSGVPDGDYKSIQFLIGVDSTRNVSGAQVGDLDVAQQMFWDWNSGYIYYKLEGNYVSADVPNGTDFAVHVGGYEYTNNCLQTCSLGLGGGLQARKKASCQINVQARVEEIFDAPVKIGLDSYYKQVVQGPKIFRDLSINYKDMFKVESVLNK